MVKEVAASIKTIFEDNALLVIDKPPGLVVTPSQTQAEETLSEILIKDYGINIERGGVVHRLDKDTSGVLLVAKTKDSFDCLQNQFKTRKVKKEYLALVHGNLDEGGVIETAISRNPRNREKFIVVPDTLGVLSSTPPRWAVTEYEPVKLLVMSSSFIEKIFHDFSKIQLKKLRAMNYERYTLLVVRPKTGRTHQIRVHLKYIGHPVVTDEKYGGRRVVRLDKRWVARQFLHAKRLGFYHPVTGDWIEFESPLPEDLESALNYLEIVKS